MRKLKLGFALEGNSDYPVIPCLTRRLITEHFPEILLDDDSTLRPRKRGHGFVAELPTFAKQLREDGVDIVIAIVDTDNKLERERINLMQKAKERCLQQRVAVCIADGLAVRKLEAWLLADEAAIFKVFDGDRTNVNFPSPESDSDPKRTLNQIVRKLTNGRELTFASFARELADSVRLRVLRQKCAYFDKYSQHLLNCVKEWLRIE
jgi:hypothetical protein